MFFTRTVIMLIVLPPIEGDVRLFNTEDLLSGEFYDCIYHKNFNYCRRPSEPISLRRNGSPGKCYHDGISHSFASLRSENISLSTILHQWSSGLEMVEEYFHDLEYPTKSSDDNERYLCQCINQRSFGKNCEYLMPWGTTFDETVKWEIDMHQWNIVNVAMYTDIVCYTTLICDSGLLCLDWRDICDGLQQCMSGSDEENCDKIEFNECENDEYRCMNGMCVPDEYFLDGEYDCMDLTDEKELFDDIPCSLNIASLTCDDRMCPPNKWSCGDGQCIFDRLSFQTDDLLLDECNSRRDQYYMCERHIFLRQWTLPNGKCYSGNGEHELFIGNQSTIDDCEYFVKCALSYGLEKSCPCQQDMSCINQYENPCNASTIQYPNGGVIAPYIFHLYNTTRDWSENTPDLILLNATIKCRGYMITQSLTIPYPSTLHLNAIEAFLCNSTAVSSMIVNTGYDQFCHNDSRTFNNHSYHFMDVCKYSKECISAYRIRDGYMNCLDELDEKQHEAVSNACFPIKHYRFQCSPDEPTCLTVNRIGDLFMDCKNSHDELLCKHYTFLSIVDNG